MPLGQSQWNDQKKQIDEAVSAGIGLSYKNPVTGPEKNASKTFFMSYSIYEGERRELWNKFCPKDEKDRNGDPRFRVSLCIHGDNPVNKNRTLFYQVRIEFELVHHNNMN
jgi:hypothetical protein